MALINQALNRHNIIVIGRKHTRPFAIKKVSTDEIIIFLHSESAANITHACMARDFNFLCLCKL